ncbi:MAG: hypothetical protein WAX89_01595 [Alphaproteobacteria bacterium]
MAITISNIILAREIASQIAPQLEGDALEAYAARLVGRQYRPGR